MKWSARDHAILRRDYPHLPTRVVAFRLRRPIVRVYARANKLGLHKTAEFQANTKASGRFDNLARAGEAHRFAKGHVPANKGTRRPGWAAGRMRETQFKKGQRPHTWRPIGTISFDPDGYAKRKVREAPYPPDAWKYIHRLLWIEHNGRIQKGHIVRFKDGNKALPILLSNLECITLRENRIRNSIWGRLPRPLALAIIARGALKRQIRRKVREQDDQRPARKDVRHDRRPEPKGRPDGSRSRACDRKGGRADHRQRKGRGRGDEDLRCPRHGIRRAA